MKNLEPREDNFTYLYKMKLKIDRIGLCKVGGFGRNQNIGLYIIPLISFGYVNKKERKEFESNYTGDSEIVSFNICWIVFTFCMRVLKNRI